MKKILLLIILFIFSCEILVIEEYNKTFIGKWKYENNQITITEYYKVIFSDGEYQGKIEGNKLVIDELFLYFYLEDNEILKCIFPGTGIIYVYERIG